jgi:thioredoxin-related protein
MKIKFLFILIFFTSLSFAQNENGAVNWLTFKEAQEKNKIIPKPFLIDVYTDWCGWCKHMMKTTYSNQGFAQYINTNFYPVKFNAEGKDTIEYNGEKYTPTSIQPRTPHALAIKFLGNKLSYPSTIFVGNNFEFNLLSQGYLDEKKMEPLLIFVVENVFKTSSYEDFEERFNKTFVDTTSFKKKEVKTYSLKEALALQKKQPKKLLINIYTNFCNSCRVMNKTTFTDTLVADYINKNFYLVNFDAESNDTIVFNNEIFYKQLIDGFPFNSFVRKVTNGYLTFPSLAILDEQLHTINVLNNYQHPKFLRPVIMYFGDNEYKTRKWTDFYQQYQAKNK